MTIKIHKYINWSLAIFTSSLFIGLLGYLIADNKDNSKQIDINCNRLTAIESRPVIDYTKQIDELTKNVVLLKVRQSSMEAKIDNLIILSADANRKMDNHMQNHSMTGRFNYE